MENVFTTRKVVIFFLILSLSIFISGLDIGGTRKEYHIVGFPFTVLNFEVVESQKSLNASTERLTIRDINYLNLFYNTLILLLIFATFVYAYINLPKIGVKRILFVLTNLFFVHTIVRNVAALLELSTFFLGNSPLIVIAVPGFLINLLYTQMSEEYWGRAIGGPSREAGAKIAFVLTGLCVSALGAYLFPKLNKANYQAEELENEDCKKFVKLYLPIFILSAGAVSILFIFIMYLGEILNEVGSI